MGYYRSHKTYSVGRSIFLKMKEDWERKIGGAITSAEIKGLIKEWQDIERTLTRVEEIWITTYDCSTRPAMAGV